MLGSDMQVMTPGESGIYLPVLNEYILIVCPEVNRESSVWESLWYHQEKEYCSNRSRFTRIGRFSYVQGSLWILLDTAKWYKIYLLNVKSVQSSTLHHSCIYVGEFSKDWRNGCFKPYISWIDEQYAFIVSSISSLVGKMMTTKIFFR